MKGRTVWFVSELYYPEVTSTGYFVTGIAQSLAGELSVAVLCGQPSYSKRGTLAPAREVRGGVRIERCWSSTLDRNNPLFRLVNAGTLGFSILLRALTRVRRGDVVIVVTNPPLLPFLMAMVARLHRAHLVLLVHDVYPDVLVAAGWIRPDGVLRRFLARVSRSLYRSTTRIVALGRDMKELIVERFAVPAGKVHIIPNWGDVAEIQPADKGRNPLIRQLGLENRFVVQYAGNMGRTHGLNQLLEAARRLAADPRFYFLFIGDGARRRWLEQSIRDQSLANARILEARREDPEVFLNACDLAVIAFQQGMAGISVPSRMYNILAAGKPILGVTDPESELARVIREEGVGWVASPGNSADIAEKLREAADSNDERRAMGLRARRAAESKYTLARVREAYRELLDAIH